MKKRQLKDAITAFDIALKNLEESLSILDDLKSDDEHYGVYEDAVIKRFEIAFEYCWKMLKTAAEYQGTEALGPRPAIQEAVRFGWIKDPEFWADALDARNGSVHDYFGIGRPEYLKIVREFVKRSEDAKKRISMLF